MPSDNCEPLRAVDREMLMATAPIFVDTVKPGRVERVLWQLLPLLPLHTLVNGAVLHLRLMVDGRDDKLPHVTSSIEESSIDES